MLYSENIALKGNPRLFKPFTVEKCRIVIFDNDPVRIEAIIAEGAAKGYLRENFTVIPDGEYANFFASYEKRARNIQHIIVNYALEYEGDNLYRRLRKLATRKSKVWYKPEEFGLFLPSAFDGLLTKINLCENDIVHHKHLIYSQRKSLFFELLTEQLHKVADDEKTFERMGQNVVERILQEILAIRVEIGENGTRKELGLEYFLPVSNGLSISLIQEEGGIEYLVNAFTYIKNLSEFGSKRAITSGIRRIIQENAIGVIQDFSVFLEVEPRHEVISRLFNAGLNSSLYTAIYKPGQSKPFGVFFGYSSQRNIFNTDHAETIEKLAKLVGFFYEKFNKNKEVNLLTEELLDGIGNVRELQDLMMGTEILSSQVMREEFRLDIDCYIRHPFIRNNSFVSLNGDGLKFKLLSDSKFQITSFDICGHGIYSGMIGLMTHTVIDTVSSGETSSAHLRNGNIHAYLEKFAREIYNYYFYNLSKGDYNNISKNMAVFNNVVFDRNEGCSYILRLGFHSPLFFSAATRSMVIGHDEWDKYNNLVVGIDPYEEIGGVNVQRICFSLGDILVFFSDGLMEQENREGVFYGTERLEEVIVKNAHESSSVIKERIIADFIGFLGGEEIANDDDLSFIIIKKL